MKKMIALLLMTGLVMGLSACTNSENTGTKKQADQTGRKLSEQQTEDDAEFTIGVCQLVQHEDLDAATEGFRDAVKDRMGDKVSIQVQNAQSDSNTCSVIVNSFVSNDVDLIMANGTPALQAAAAGTDTIPILGTCVTDYALALDLKEFDGTVGGNISGTSDVSPLDQQADMIKELFPDEKKIGVLYCSAEINAKSQVEEISKYLEGMGYQCQEYTFSDSNDLAAVVTKAAKESDVIYTPTDNTVGANTGIIKNICLDTKVPVFTGSETICRGCGVATLCLDAYDLGYETGQMAADILEGKEDISTMPIQNAPKFTKKYNSEMCQTLNVKIPDDYIAIEN
ncbi:ABC-type uncharacterized transport system%2C periplasmic component [uncultured Roseburia sp.]|nr:ABC-type uncharacterized transport system%2C periplasmic component [uncultured Roseburia sp.]